MKQYNLENRTHQFALETRRLMRKLTASQTTIDDIRQLIRSSGSVGANYIEADESLSKKDFIYRIKICRKEAKESAYWISLISDFYPGENKVLSELRDEANQLKRIFSTIIKKAS